MGRQLLSLLSFNRGIVSRLGLARIDLKRLALSAQVMTNWMPRVLGSMSLRAGLGYLGSIFNNSPTRMLPFVFATDDTALLELTNGAMRVWVNDALVSRTAVLTLVANGTFATNLTYWIQNDEAGAVSQWGGANLMQLNGSGAAAAIRDQQVIPDPPGVLQALRVVIAHGPVTFMVGTSLGDDSYVSETVLNTGTHSLAFTPAGNFFIRFLSIQAPAVFVSQCTIESAGVMEIPTPWLSADLNNIAYDQSADVIFVACVGYQQRRIERRDNNSWSVVMYTAPDGPFMIPNVSPTTLTTSDLTGNIIVTASTPIFRSSHVGALFQITSSGQNVAAKIVAQNTFTAGVTVIGITTERAFAIVIGNTFSGTVTLQRSVDSITGPWSDVPSETWTAPVTASYTDGLDNQIIYYRIGIKTGDYVSGEADCQLIVGTGSLSGVVRVTAFIDTSNVDAEVLKPLGATVATDNWAEGWWSDLRGWPTAVCFHEGRLWWAGQGYVYGSVSDAFDSFDPTVVGDSGTIQRSIGSGPVDTINWIMSLQRMILGAQGAEWSVRASSFDTPLTPTDFLMRAASTQGSKSAHPLKIDQRGIFVNRSGIKVYSLDFNLQKYDYVPTDMTALVPELGMPGIVRTASQRQPDTRIHCVRSDGVGLVLVTDSTEDVTAWVQVQTDGFIEDVVVLPALSGDIDDQVYYVVRRTINGATVRYLEKWAQEVECRGNLPLCKLADSFVVSTGAPRQTITGLSNLEGQQVVVWADGKDVGTDDSVVPWVQQYTVSGGQITLAAPASNVVVGLPYSAQFQSSKLGTAAPGVDSPLNQQKKINHLGLILADVHPRGLQYGPEFTYLDDMPLIEQGTLLDPDTVVSAYDENTIEFPGEWTTDMRLCLQAQAPRPCTVMAATIDGEVNR